MPLAVYSARLVNNRCKPACAPTLTRKSSPGVCLLAHRFWLSGRAVAPLSASELDVYGRIS